MTAPRLLWLHQNFVSARQAGNSRAIHTLAALLEAGWAIDVVCTAESYLGEAYREGAPRVERDGALTLHRLAARPGARPAARYVAFCAAATAYARRLPRADAMLASTPSLPQVAPAVALAAWRRIPLVLEVRDLWPAFLVEGELLRPGATLAAMRALEALAYRRAVECVSVSPAFVPYLTAMGVPPERVTVAPTGGDPHLARQEEPARAFRARYDLGDRFVVLYAGSFNEAYGTGLLADAAERLRDRDDVAWVFAGGGRDAPSVARRVAALPRARWLGLVPKDDLLPAFWAADVGINLHAPWPLLGTTVTGKLFDYLSAGLPVIDLAGGLMGRIVTASGAGRTIARDPGALADAVLALAGTAAATRVQWGRAGRAWVMRHAPSAASARAVAAAVERARRHGPHGVALGRDVVGALRELRGERSKRALAALYGPSSREATLDRAFAAWAAQEVADPTPLALPAILRAPTPGTRHAPQGPSETHGRSGGADTTRGM